MICCFSLDLNDIEGGESMGFYVQGLTEPDKVVGKRCIVKLYEIDTLVGKRKETTPDDLLAEFETVVEKGSKKGDFYFNLDKTRRIDTFPKVLPSPEFLTDPTGNKLPIPLKYTPPYFKVFFDSGAPRPAESDLHVILIRGDEDEIEMFNYEIGFSIELDDEMIFDARKMVAYVVCLNLLVDNCKNAVDFTVENHYQLINSRGCGTHFGNMFTYRFKDEKEYLKEVRRINPAIVESKKGQWIEAEKVKFDRENNLYGLQMTNCIDFILDSMEAGFSKTLMKQEWKKCISQITRKRSGQELAKGLTDVGWVALFYAPDAVHFYDLDLEGVHKSSFETAKTKRQYGNENIKPIVPVFDFVINYAPTKYYEDDSVEVNSIEPELDQIAKVLKIPFAFLLAKHGYHTALLIEGKVTEVHWEANPYANSFVFQTGKSFVFKPPPVGSDQTCATWEWMSGIILVPRLFWPKANYSFI